MDNIEVTSPNLRYLQPPLLLRNTAGHFASVDGGPAMQKLWAGRGAGFGDLENDGGIDMVVTNIGQKAYVLHNNSASRNGWLRLELTGQKSNRDGIGCRIRVTSASNLVQYYTVNTAVGYLSASDKRPLIGLGPSRVATSVEITWPSGVVQRFANVPSGTTLAAKEPVAAS
jgi:hypothetical protein